MVGVLGVNPISKDSKRVEMPHVTPGMRVIAPYKETIRQKVDTSEEIAKLNDELKAVEQAISEFRHEWAEGLKNGEASERIGYSTDRTNLIDTPEGISLYATQMMQEINSALKERIARRNAIVNTINYYADYHVESKVTKTCETVVVSISPIEHGNVIKWTATVRDLPGQFDINSLRPAGWETEPIFTPQELIILPVIKPVTAAKRFLSKLFNSLFNRASEAIDLAETMPQVSYLVDLVKEGFVRDIRTEPYGINYVIAPQEFMVVAQAVIAPGHGRSFRVFLTKPDQKGLYAASSENFSVLHSQSRLLMMRGEVTGVFETGEYPALESGDASAAGALKQIPNTHDSGGDRGTRMLPPGTVD
ncbi:hypothetical protein HY570_01540 [Candidatus Micrarchaeota archaeon]|nr:hypothetical protein [Candidatus Micrarchaeota archaeon]